MAAGYGDGGLMGWPRSVEPQWALVDLDGVAQVMLTREGRRLLSGRVRVLRVEVLPPLRAVEDLSVMAVSTPSSIGRSRSCAV